MADPNHQNVWEMCEQLIVIVYCIFEFLVPTYQYKRFFILLVDDFFCIFDALELNLNLNRLNDTLCLAKLYNSEI